MNYWSLNKKSSVTLRIRLEQLIFKYVGIQPSERKNLDKFITLSNYIISYTIIFVLIMQGLARQLINSVDRDNALQNQRLTITYITNQTYQAALVLFLVRFALTILYILFQKVQYLIAAKTLLIVNLFLSEYQTLTEHFLPIEIPLLLFEFLALAVWAYKIQTRILHFDSRLDNFKPFAKEVLIFLTSFLMRRLQKASFYQLISGETLSSLKFSPFQIEASQLIIIFLVLILFIDFTDMIYQKEMKRFIIGLDFAFLAFLISWIVCIRIAGKNIVYSNYIMLLVSLIVMQLSILFNKDDFHILYEIQGKKLQYLSQSNLIQYFESLRRLIKDNQVPEAERNIQIIKFIQFHKKSCLYPACPFTKRFNISDSVFLKSQLIEEYMIKILEQLSKTRPNIKAYLIFYLSPRDKVFRYLTGDQSYQRRELWRINQTKREMSNQIRILEAQSSLKKLNDYIEEYLSCGKKYFQILMNEHVNGGNLIIYGGRMLELIQQIEKMKENSINFTQAVRILLNNFSTRLINDRNTQILQTVVDPPFLINRTTEIGPTMIVSAEPQNFLRIIDANIACTKQFYYPKEVFLSATTIDLLPEQIKVKHREHFNKISKKTDFDGKKDFPTSLFVTNKNGFMSFFTAVIYALNSIKGRMWCVTVEITHKMDAILLVAMEKNGVVMGISEMAVFHGLKTTDKGKQLTQKFHKKLKTKQVGTNKYMTIKIDGDESIFQDCNFTFGTCKQMLIVEQFRAFGLTYFLVDIKQANESDLAKCKSENLEIQKQLENSQKPLNSENELIHIPKKQFFYHSDGKVRTKQQDQQSLQVKFAPKQERKTTIVQIKGDLSEGISQMVLIKDRLDYLENIERQKDFMSQPKTQMEKREQELKNFTLSLDFFKESLHQRESKVPKWLRRTRVFFVAMGLTLLSILITSLIMNISLMDKASKQAKIMNGVQEIQSNYIELSYLMLSAKYYDTQVRQDLRHRILKNNKDIEMSSVNIYSMDQTVGKYLGNSEAIKAISSYSISMSNLIEASQNDITAFNEQPVLLSLIFKVIPLFEALTLEKISSLDTQVSKSTSLLLFIIFSLLLAVFCFWVYFTSQQTSTLKNNIIKIMTKINDNVFERQMTKLRLFEEYLYFGKDIYEEDDLEFFMKEKQKKDINSTQNKCIKVTIGSKGTLHSSKKRIIHWKNAKQQNEEDYQKQLVSSNLDGIITTQLKLGQAKKSKFKSQEEQEDKTFVKKLVNQQKTHRVKFITFGWVLLVWWLSFMFYRSVENFQSVSKRVIKIEYNLRRIHTSADILWTMLNTFPSDMEQMDYHYRSFFSAKHQYKKEVAKMIIDKKLSQEFFVFFNNIWMEDCCQYIENKLPLCRNVIGGGLAEGADQIFSYLGRKFNYFMNLKMNKSEFHSSQIAQNVSEMGLQYLNQVIRKNKEMLANEQTTFYRNFQNEQILLFLILAITMGVMILVYKLLSGQNRELIKVEKLFKLIEFDSLKNNKQLKFYFKKNYHDKIHR